MTAKQLVESYEAGNMGDVEFFELALAAGMDPEAIGVVMSRARDWEDETEDEHDCGEDVCCCDLS